MVKVHFFRHYYFTKLLSLVTKFSNFERELLLKNFTNTCTYFLYQDAKFCGTQILRTGYSLAEDPETSCCEVLQNTIY
jgi:hypothetical protein